eukprot:m.123465 g.123465  ORF g.123465 m.123465 type:complete len:65 (-) comp12948_c1_seq4:972-1166(-)
MNTVQTVQYTVLYVCHENIFDFICSFITLLAISTASVDLKKQIEHKRNRKGAEKRIIKKHSEQR